jgi:hypothetical protein
MLELRRDVLGRRGPLRDRITAQLMTLLLIIKEGANEEQGTERWVDHRSVQPLRGSRGIIATSLHLRLHRGMYHERSGAAALDKWEYYKDYY